MPLVSSNVAALTLSFKNARTSGEYKPNKLYSKFKLWATLDGLRKKSGVIGTKRNSLYHVYTKLSEYSYTDEINSVLQIKTCNTRHTNTNAFAFRLIARVCRFNKAPL